MKNYLLFFIGVFSFQSLVFAQVPNDECTTAIDLGVVPYCESVIYTNINATKSDIGAANIPFCFNGGVVNNDVWFAFRIPADGSIENFEVTVASAEVTGIRSHQVAIYRGDCEAGELSELGVCTSAENNEKEISIEALGLIPGTQYYLRINDFSATATPNWGNFTVCIEALAPFFNMGEVEGTSLCSGTLYDSGGQNGDYFSGENTFFTICPTDFHQCIEIVVEQYDTEAEFDAIRIFDGEGDEANLLSTISGAGQHSLAYAESNCATINFTSDNSVVSPGFKLSWNCTPAACPKFEETTCEYPVIIPDLPFHATNLSTCFSGNSIEDGPCSSDNFLLGNEYIFAYDSPGGECVSIIVNGTIPETGVSLIKGCPSLEEAICISQTRGNDSDGEHTIPNISLKEKGRYYIVIAHEFNCTPFSIRVEKSTNCPIVFPSAADCSNALILNGCTSHLPTALTVAPGQGDADFFRENVNDGCWEGVLETNYTWFVFEAQADGEFAFLLRNNIPDEVVDIDFNVWGPFDTMDDACDGSKNSQPIRSSWADDLIYSVTGITNTNPILGTPVTSTCQGSISDGFVKPLSVKKEEVYVVLINDFDGVIFSGAVAIDFSETSPGVLDNIPNDLQVSSDTTICFGESVALLAEGASLYEWGSSESLSCRNCPNPIAFPSRTTTYTLNASGVCSSEKEEVKVEVIIASAGPDRTVCIGAQIPMEGNDHFSSAQYQWISPNGVQNLSCTACPNPIISAVEAGVFEYIVQLTSATCTYSDTMLLTVLDGAAPVFDIAEDHQICVGTSINLGREGLSGQSYEWTSSKGNFSSSEPNPIVSPTETTTYYSTVSIDACPVPTLDSVTIEVATPPIIELINDTLFCQETTAVLGKTTVEEDVTYEWTSTNITDIENPLVANPVVRPTSNAIYTLTATRGGCSTKASVAIDITKIDIYFQNKEANENLCLGETLSLDLVVLPLATLPQIYSLNGALDTNATFLELTPNYSQTYIATVTANGCFATDTLRVQVDSLPQSLSINPSDTTVCEGTQLILTAPIYDPIFFPSIQHVWTPNVGFETPDSFYNLVLTALDSVALKRITTNGVCRDTSLARINVIKTNAISVEPAAPIICKGEAIQLTATLPEGAENIIWTPMESMSCTNCPNPVFAPSNSTIYTITASIMDCPIMGSKTIEVITGTMITLNNNGTDSIYQGELVDLTLAADTEILSVEWFENDRKLEGYESIHLNYAPLTSTNLEGAIQSITLKAEATTLEGCQTTAEIVIIVLPPNSIIPNAFTPDGDRINDHFNILLNNPQNLIQEFKIYNRWGQLVYDNDDPINGWNGQLRNRGSQQPPDAYVYTIQYLLGESVKTISGDVTLIR